MRTLENVFNSKVSWWEYDWTVHHMVEVYPVGGFFYRKEVLENMSNVQLLLNDVEPSNE